MEHFVPGPSNTSLLRLQDSHIVKSITGPIDGKTITGDTSLDWIDLCVQLSGVAPTDRQIIGQWVQHTWLESIYQELPQDADEEVVEQHAITFILRMIGGFLMPDISVSRVHLMYLPLLDDLLETFEYSWGSAVLVCLYRGLCRAVIVKEQKEVGGCLLLLQSWAYDHIPILAPRLHDTTLQFFPLVKRWSQHLITTNIPGHATNIIRAMLDRLCVNQFVWTPYTTMNIMGPISDICRASVPLICFTTVEWHADDRVMRQFGLQQTIPQDPPNFDKLHKMDLRSKNEYN
ncbi:hypothetical protein Lal_00008334 [Lupinus albus]|nr:hypothetical protein Lal_00008334 [Lupinus albus]